MILFPVKTAMMQSSSNRRFIHAGDIHIATKPTEIVTVLGSCVAVCLYDGFRGISGMNHYLLPLWKDHDLKTPRYGDISIEHLIENMLSNGAKLSSLEAKLFGGANMSEITQEQMMVGKKNIMVANAMLERYRIPIVAQDIGGNKGRRISMQSQTGKVLLRYVQRGEI